MSQKYEKLKTLLQELFQLDQPDLDFYVNGGNNLENLKTPDDLWKVRLIEEDFQRLMFAVEGA